MNRNILSKKLLVTGVALGAGLACGVANAAVFYLCAGTTTQMMPDGTEVVMWGYAEDDNANLADGCGGPVQSPGPILHVPSAQGVIVHLRNDLAVDTSLVVPGQSAAMTPVFTTDGEGRQRVTSLTHVTAPGAIGTYRWSNFKPGSYVYQSGTHMALQVQMGLFGGLKKNVAAGVAYTDTPYDREAIIFYSEVDPVLHAAVADGSYATTGPTSTLNYHPKYFLVNGVPYGAGSAPITAARAGQRTLLRFYNMGLRTIAPTLLGQHLKVVAEDGRPYPYPREQYSLMMAAGKTHDAIFTAQQNGTYAVYDRLLNLSSGSMAPGGFYAFLRAGNAAAGRPLATPDSYSVAEDTPLSIAAPGVLGNDSDPDGGTLSALLASAAANGSVSLASDGSFNFTPAANFNGTAQFSYLASDGINSSDPATVSITVTPVNDGPVALDDSYETNIATPLTIAAPGVLANDSDIDSTIIRVRPLQVTLPTQGTLNILASGAFTYTPNPGFTGIDSFTYRARDDLGANSNVATVTITVNPAPVNQPPVAVEDNATTPKNTPVVIDVLANDTDADGSLVPSSVVMSGTLKTGNSAVVNGNGTITFTPRDGFRGSDSFSYTVLDDDGAVSNSALVRIDVTR